MAAHPLLFWLLQALASVLMAAAVLPLANALQRHWKIADGARGYWIGVWAVAALPPLLLAAVQVLLPGALPSVPVALPLPLPLEDGASLLHATAITSTVPRVAWPSMTAVVAAAYLAGVCLSLLRTARACLQLRRLLRATVAVGTDGWPGPRSSEEAKRLHAQGIDLRVTHQAMTPFALRWPRPTIVVPADALQHLDDAGLRLVLRHEAAHLHLGDPQRAWLMRLVDALLWFNPLLRRIEARVQLACELRCDALALQGDTDAGHALATAYVQTLRCYAGAPPPVAALSHRGFTAHALRIGHMLRGGAASALSVRQRVGAGAFAVLLVTAVGTAQLSLATAATPPATITTPATAPAVVQMAADAPAASTPASLVLAYPVDVPRITGHFGDTGGPRSRAHRGMDFGARVGTAVRAPAAGTVIAATDTYPDGPQYGRVVVIDHGNGWQSLYAHLDSYLVQPGQAVASGELIARVGRSGKVTGPHLHLEVLHDGARVDPQTLLR